jgi:hypothetical protein
LGDCATSSKQFRSLIESDSELQESVKAIKEELRRCYVLTKSTVKSSYSAAHTAWMEVKRWDKAALEANPTVEALAAAMGFWTSQMTVAQNMHSGDTFGCFQLSAVALKNQLLPEVEECLKSVIEVNMNTARVCTKRQLARYRARAARLQLRPNDLLTFCSHLECLKTIEDGMPALIAHKVEIDALYKFLKSDGSLAHADLMRLRDVEQRAEEFDEEVTSCRAFCDTYMTTMRDRLKSQYVKVNDEIKILNEEFQAPGVFDNVGKYDEAHTVIKQLHILERRLNHLGNEALTCRRQAVILGADSFDMTWLNQCQSLYDDVFTLWGMISEFEEKRNAWMKDSLETFDVRYIWGMHIHS